MVDVYYPFFEKEAKWQELKYSLRSLDKHLKEDFRVFIVGDLPDNIVNVIHIPHARSEGMKENCTYDAITKMSLYLNHPKAGQSFIRMYDDTYLISDLTVEEVSRVKAICNHDNLPPIKGVWMEQLKRTLKAVMDRGCPGINTETHFPEYFVGGLMKFVLNSFNALEDRLLTSTLYYNTYFEQSVFEYFSRESNMGIQFYGGPDGIYKSSNEGDLVEKCNGKLYLNHNNAGLNDNLKQFIMNRFPEKSRFEK